MTPAVVKEVLANIDVERFVFGSILLDDSVFIEIAGSLQSGDFYQLPTHLSVVPFCQGDWTSLTA